MRVKRLIISLLSIGVALNSSAAPLRCNYRSADISPLEDEHCMLAGFAARKNLHDGVHTPLRASAMAFTDGSTRICIVSMDLMELSPALSSEMRDSISARSGLEKDNILLHCIHTHSAPRMGGKWVLEGAPNESYKKHCMETIVDLAVKTIKDEKSFRPFSMEIGSTTTTIAHNRCEEAGPIDRTVYAVRFMDKKGSPICAFINMACHPVCMGPGSYISGADYSGVARGIISEKWGCEVFQLSGGQGNLDPAKGPRKKEYAEECGRSLADSLATIVFKPFKMDGTLALGTHTAKLPFKIPEVSVKDIHHLADSLRESAKTAFPRFVDDVTGWEEQMVNELGERTIKCCDYNMEAFNLGGMIFFFTQGEPFCEYQMDTRAAFRDKTVIWAGYTNGQSLYVASQRAYQVRKGYEYELDQICVYAKLPYSLSSSMPKAFQEGIFKTISKVAGVPRYDIIPLPVSLKPSEGSFILKKGMRVWADSEFEDVAEDFRAQIKAAAGFRTKAGKVSSKGIEIVKVEGLTDEAYRLTVSPKKVTVEASSFGGAFYGIQTLCQLLPAEIYGSKAAKGIRWEAPCCTVEDQPRYSYRGMLLDCGRYFYPKEEVLKFIDIMAMHKQNYLQWHLTEDQGWRIEIKKYPLLTEVGAWRKETVGYSETGDNTPHGGFYTQDDIREIVEFARRRNVTIIPEIELPGHSSAAIAAYPWLSCTPDEPKEVNTHWGVKEDVYCPSPETVQFLEDVFSEVLELFPSKYYHIGGDECPKTAWQSSEYCKTRAAELGLASVDDLQDYFVKHFDKFLREHGKTVIGWDEILDGDPGDSTVVMSYRGHNPASKALDRRMRTILCPNRWCYFDYQQQEIEDIPSNHHLFLTLRKSYNWDWESFVDDTILEKAGDNMLGVQACVWGEHIPDVETLQRQTYPREASIAETAWTAKDKKSWYSFRARIPKELQRLDAKEVNYSNAFDNVIVNMSLLDPYPRQVDLEIDNPHAFIHYTTDGTEPTSDSELAPAVIMIQKGSTVKAQAFLDDGTAVGETMTRTF